jgi:hypothetical protein
MKIISDTEMRLTLGDRPWLLGLGITAAAVGGLWFGLDSLMQGDMGGAIMGALAFGFCLVAFAVFVRRTIVFLDRPSGRVVVRVASVFGTRETGAALADVAQAEVSTKRATKSDEVDSHRPILRMTSGEVLILREVFVSGRGSDTAVARINGWLARRKA